MCTSAWQRFSAWFVPLLLQAQLLPSFCGSSASRTRLFWWRNHRKCFRWIDSNWTEQILQQFPMPSVSHWVRHLPRGQTVLCRVWFDVKELGSLLPEFLQYHCCYFNRSCVYFEKDKSKSNRVMKVLYTLKLLLCSCPFFTENFLQSWNRFSVDRDVIIKMY